MPARLPPLGAIEAFAAAARTLSFTDAARELNLTASAVSRRVAHLEHTLGVALFHRVTRGLRLTTAGEAYAASIAPALEQLRAAGASLAPAARGGTVRLAALPSFTALWLFPRLTAFEAAHPAVDLRLTTIARAPDATREDVDLAIAVGTGPWRGWMSERLMAMRCRPVCAPALRDGKPGLRTPADLEHHTLLGVSQPRGFWRRWCREAGLPPFPPRRHLRFDGLHLLYEAAASGLGVALAFDDLVAPYLADGRLVEPFAHSFVPDEAYYLLARPRERRRSVRLVRDWLMRATHASMR
ncbi:MAG: LysR family transcriptional regulator [Alphaproteobacteria bacterium]|nr:LysR family transcriptional regulator [Alphaproteobacteria bacterium]